MSWVWAYVSEEKYINMHLPRFVRNTAFHIARQDLAIFLDEHEDRLIEIFREEITKLDDEIPEENLFIDIKMAPLGEMVLKASLHALRRFLTEDIKEGDRL